MANTQFGKYTLHDHIGMGATANVYKAWDNDLGRWVALKVLKPALVTDRTSFERFRQEATAASNLFHDSIATVLDMGEQAGYYYIVIKYVEGFALDKAIQRRPLSWEQTLKLTAQVGGALDFAHSKGFLHRDVKPNNIMMTPEGDFVLTDFGLALAAQNSGLTSTTGVILGTPAYIPPEVWNGAKSTAASDQYALACVVVEALTGKIAYGGDSPQVILTKHLVSGPSLPDAWPKGVPAGLSAVLLRALNRDPGQRYRNCAEFSAALAKAPAGMPQAAAPVQPPVQVPIGPQTVVPAGAAKKGKSSAGKKIFSCALVAVLLLLVLGGGGLFFAMGGLDSILGMVSGADQSSGPVVLPFLVTASPEQPAQAASVATVTPVVVVVVQEPTPTSPPAQPTPTPSEASAPAANTPAVVEAAPAAVVDNPAGELVGSGVVLDTVSGSGLVIQMAYGDGSPVDRMYAAVYTQKKDIAGKLVQDERKWDGYTDNTGMLVLPDVPNGHYIVRSDWAGYNWGTAGDCYGQADVVVQSGQATRLTLRLSRIVIGFLKGNQETYQRQYVSVFTQKKDIAGKWVVDARVVDGYTDNSGSVTFNLTPGYYIVGSDLRGYNWGNATDRQGTINVPLQTGQVSTMTISTGRLVVGLLDGSGNAQKGVYVEVLTQQKDSSGKESAAQSIGSGYTENDGTLIVDLTAGVYVLKIRDNYIYNVPVEAGKITVTDGVTAQVK